MKLLAFILLFVSVFLPSQPAQCQSPGEEPADPILVFDMGKIEVVGSVPQTETVAVTEVKSETFDEKALESIVEVLPSAPGLSVTTGSKNEPQLVMRGFRQERVLILYDGVPLAAPYYSDIDTSEIPLDGVSEVTIVRGNASVLYGPNAMAGVVAISSAKPSDRPNLNVFASIDQESNFIGRIGHGARWNDWYYQVSAGLRSSDGWRMSDDFKTTYDEDGYVLEDGDIRDHSAFDQWSAGLKVGYEWDRGEISVSGNYINAQKDIPTTTSPMKKISYWDFPTWKQSGVVMAGRFQVSDSFELRGNLYYHTYDNVLKNYKDPEYSSVRWESTFDDYSTGAIIRGAYKMSDDLSLRASLNTALDDHRAQGNSGDPWEEYQAGTYSIGAEAEWVVSKPFRVLIGAGYEIYNFKSLDSPSIPDNLVNERAEDVTAPTFSMVAEYHLQEAHHMTAGISYKNRFPNMSQLFSNIEEFPPEEITTLETEQSMQYSLGYQYQPSLIWNLGATVYYYDVDNLIERPNRDALYDNIDTAEFKGFECWASYQSNPGLMAKFGFTHQIAEGTRSQGPQIDLPYVPENIIQLDTGYQFSFGTRIIAGYTFKDDSIEYDDYGDKVDIPSFSLISCGVYQTLWEDLTVSLIVQNLTDKNYYTESGFEQPGRTFKVSLRYVL